MPLDSPNLEPCYFPNKNARATMVSGMGYMTTATHHVCGVCFVEIKKTYVLRRLWGPSTGETLFPLL